MAKGPWTNRRLRNLLARYARRFRLKWLPKGDPNPEAYGGYDIRPGSVTDEQHSCGYAFITKMGTGTGVFVADNHGSWIKVSPNALDRAIREGKGSLQSEYTGFYKGRERRVRRKSWWTEA